MELSSIITLDRVLPGLKAGSKKQLLQELAQTAALATGIDDRVIFDTLLQRERLGSTGVGLGVAIPHGKFQNLPGITGIFARLAKPISFDAMDDEPVDIVFALLAPEGSGADHLKALSRIARLLRDPDTIARLRNLTTASELYEELTSLPQANAA